MPRIIGTILLLTCSMFGIGQQGEVVKILNADQWLYDEAITDAQRLIGHVKLQYKDMLMSCDSAYQFEAEVFEAYGNVKINQGDTLQLFGDLLFLNGTENMARLRKDIRLKDKSITLTTDKLNYDLETEIASYFEGGKIVSSTGNNVLTSTYGYYDSKGEVFHFKDNVELTNPEYKVVADTLKYYSVSEVAHFLGPTNITTKDTHIYCENGRYNTKTDICQFNENAIVTSRSTELKGDSIYFNGQLGIGKAFNNVEIHDTTSNYAIFGDYGWHDDRLSSSFVTDSAMMVQYFDTDSLFLHADTLKSNKLENGKNLISAHKNVRFYKPDLQGKADSLSFSEGDSTLTLFNDPLLWTADNQILGDTIVMKMYGGKIDKLFVWSSAFIVAKAGEDKFNQIKGKEMTGFFRDNALYKVQVNGNGQTVYYAEEESESGTRPIGVSKIECSDILIFIEESEIQRLSFLKAPSGNMLPISQSTKSETELKGFRWDTASRPQSKSDIFSTGE
jgi:lipopolysaccharide export system protein LptA